MGPLPETPKFTLRLPEELKAELREVAKAEGRPLTNLMVQWLREHLAEYRRRQNKSP